MQDFITKNLYFSLCSVALLAGVLTYVYFFNREVLGIVPSEEIGAITSGRAESEILPQKTEIVVDVSGAVDSPGVYTLNSGSRLADLIVLAGGATDEVSEKWISRNLNLAAVLYDQQKVYVPFVWEVAPSAPEYEIKELVLESPKPSEKDLAHLAALAGSPVITAPATPSTAPQEGTSTSAGSDLINLNQATQDLLKELPGVGDVWSERIIEHRPYTDFDDFREKTGATENFVNKISDLVTF